MRRTGILAAVLCGLVVPSVHGTDIRSFKNEFAVGSGITTVKIEVPVGDLILNGYEGTSVQADVTVRYSGNRADAEKLTKDVKLVSKTKGDELEIEIDGIPDWHDMGISLKVYLTVPSTLALRGDLGVGDLTVRGMAKDLTLHVGVGDANVGVRQKGVGSVKIRCGVGDATLDVAGKHVEGHGFIGHVTEWAEGTGPAKISIDVGVGEGTVKLE